MSSILNKNDIANKIDKVSSLVELEELRIHYLGKKGLLTSEMKSLSSLSIKEKKETGQKLNLIKTFLWGATDCSEITWRGFGLTMPAWALIYFIVMTLINSILFGLLQFKYQKLDVSN